MLGIYDSVYIGAYVSASYEFSRRNLQSCFKVTFSNLILPSSACLCLFKKIYLSLFTK